MRFIQQVLVSASLGLIMAAATASPTAPQNGAEYRTLNRQQPTDAGKKVEVTEFFWYSCPHCFAFEPSLAEWVKKNADNITFKRVPIAFRDSFIPQQKLYYSLEAMGKSEEMQRKVFNAIHVERQQIDTDATILDFVGKQGLDKQKFADVYNSFGMQSKVRQATSMQEAYKIDGVPTIAIDGKYITSPSIVGTAFGKSQPENVLATSTLQVMDALVAKAQAERKGATATPAAKAPVKK